MAIAERIQTIDTVAKWDFEYRRNRSGQKHKRADADGKRPAWRLPS